MAAAASRARSSAGASAKTGSPAVALAKMGSPAIALAKTGSPAAALAKAGFYRPCWAEVNVGALEKNLKALRARIKPATRVLAVVKADGYGHGLLPCAQAALRGGAAYLGVSSLEEGIRLREGGIKTSVLLLGSLFPFGHFDLLFKHRLTPTVASVETAEALSAIARKRGERLAVHLKIDTGFGRIGVSWTRALAFIQEAAALPNLELEGLYTHFSSSDTDEEETRRQTEHFLKVVEEAGQKGIRPKFLHMANSAALLRFPETHGTLVRPGIALYGILPYAEAARDVALLPALTWKSKIIFLKQWPQGAAVGYACAWRAQRPSRVATLAVGYADGFPRHLSNKGSVLIRGQRLPVIGRVTMDMIMVDVTDLKDCRVGDEAVLIGRQEKEELTARDLAEWAGTNAYEIVSRIGPRVPRIYSHG
jgi:alanine racemase